MCEGSPYIGGVDNKAIKVKYCCWRENHSMKTFIFQVYDFENEEAVEGEIDGWLR